MDLLSSPENPILILERFNGFEAYPIELSEWNLYKDDNGMMNLWIFLSTGRAIIQKDDTKSLNANPNWELNLVEPNLPESSICCGFRATIPESYDENRSGWITNFYFCEHEGTDNNTIEVIEVDGDQTRFRLLGETVDVNYYDGSKPSTKLIADTWFERNRGGRRSMQ
jgi:hypothetical protein